MDELMALPVRINSGSSTTFASWLALIPFVPPPTQNVDVDAIGLAEDGYKVRVHCAAAERSSRVCAVSGTYLLCARAPFPSPPGLLLGSLEWKMRWYGQAS